MTKIIVVGTYYGSWPVWFPAFLLSCSSNASIQWLFFTDCQVPDVQFENIRFERLSLAQLNEIAAARLGTAVRKGPYSQSDLRPAYGVVFADYLRGFDFWGHCDFDVIWGDVRRFLPDTVLMDHDLVSCRREFLAGHLTLWRNRPDVNELFRSVPSHRDVFRSELYFNMDEAIISTFLKSQMAAGQCPLRVHWPAQMVRWFRGDDSPDGWSWREGRVFDARGREQVYLHLQEAKARVESIDFGVGERPGALVLTRSGIESRPAIRPVAVRSPARRAGLGAKVGRVGWGVIRAARTSRRALALRDVSWASALTDAGIGVEEVRRGSQDAIVLTRVGLCLQRRQAGFLAAYRAALDLVNHCGARFSNGDGGSVEVVAAGIRLSMGSAADIFALRDLLVSGIYNWQFRDPTVVIDVGAGAGLAALRFASQPGVTVIGYEPCASVHQRAVRNVALNPGLADRIRMVRAGLGSLSCRTIAMFPPRATESDAEHGPVFEYEEVDILDAAEGVRAVRDEFPGHRLMLKVTYERVEYATDGLSERELLARLRETRQLEELAGVMGVWTGSRETDRAEHSAEDLCEDGFQVLVTRPCGDARQMVYAARSEAAGRRAAGRPPGGTPQCAGIGAPPR